jgi:hypothetical protein
MSKLEGVKTIVVGGKSDVKQEYCGTVGGQSRGFSAIDTEIKVRRLATIKAYATVLLNFSVSLISDYKAQEPYASPARSVRLPCKNA